MKPLSLMLLAVTVALADIATLCAEITPRFANVSARARVGSGDDTFILGFVVRDGEAAVLVRAMGPALAVFGVSNSLPDPLISVYDANGLLVAKGLPLSELSFVEHEAVMTAWARAGAFFAGPTNTKDASAYLKLAPGVYTLHITSKSGSSGVVLGEIYSLLEPTATSVPNG